MLPVSLRHKLEHVHLYFSYLNEESQFHSLRALYHADVQPEIRNVKLKLKSVEKYINGQNYTCAHYFSVGSIS